MKPELLLKLADYLDAGQFLHKEFNYKYVDDGPITENGCGTAGCALGELPGCFPQDWHFSVNGIRSTPFLKGTEEHLTVKRYVHQHEIFAQVEEYFGISNRMADHLFNPYQQYEHFKELGENATPKQVARNIRKTVKLELSGNKRHKAIVERGEYCSEEEET